MVKYRRAEGCTTVEMECAALAACARKRGASFGQILYAADSLANVLEHDERDWGKGLLTESTGTLYRSATSDLKVQVPLRMLGHTARTRIRFSMRKGSGTFFVYGKSYGESTQNGKQEQVKAGYHCGGGILPFVRYHTEIFFFTFSPSCRIPLSIPADAGTGRGILAC